MNIMNMMNSALGDVLAENSDLLSGMVRSLLQSPAVRLDPEFWLNPRIHVCPRCELPIPQNWKRTP